MVHFEPSWIVYLPTIPILEKMMIQWNHLDVHASTGFQKPLSRKMRMINASHPYFLCIQIVYLQASPQKIKETLDWQRLKSKYFECRKNEMFFHHAQPTQKHLKTTMPHSCKMNMLLKIRMPWRICLVEIPKFQCNHHHQKEAYFDSCPWAEIPTIVDVGDLMAHADAPKAERLGEAPIWVRLDFQENSAFGRCPSAFSNGVGDFFFGWWRGNWDGEGRMYFGMVLLNFPSFSLLQWRWIMMHDS